MWKSAKWLWESQFHILWLRLSSENWVKWHLLPRITVRIKWATDGRAECRACTLSTWRWLREKWPMTEPVKAGSWCQQCSQHWGGGFSFQIQLKTAGEPPRRGDETHIAPRRRENQATCSVPRLSLAAYPMWRARTVTLVAVSFGFPQICGHIPPLKNSYFKDHGIWSYKFCVFALFLNPFVLFPTASWLTPPPASGLDAASSVRPDSSNCIAIICVCIFCLAQVFLYSSWCPQHRGRAPSKPLTKVHEIMNEVTKEDTILLFHFFLPKEHSGHPKSFLASLWKPLHQGISKISPEHTNSSLEVDAMIADGNDTDSLGPLGCHFVMFHTSSPTSKSKAS